MCHLLPPVGVGGRPRGEDWAVELKLGDIGITSGERGGIRIVVDQRQSRLDAGGEQDGECGEEDGVNHRWSVVVSND
jgi:hypothetical protein